MKGKKWKEVRSALVMVLVMVSTLSTATYAWFSLTTSPTVTGLQMTAASTEGLKISETGADGTFYDAIDIKTQATDTNKMLTPVSLKDSKEAEFYEPVYTGNKVTALETDPLAADALSGHVAKYTYYLKSEAGEVNVGIIAADTTANDFSVDNMGVDTSNQAKMVGSFVVSTGTTSEDAAYAVRVGFVVDGGDMIIYEPNSDGTNEGTVSFAENGVTDITSTVSSKCAGTIGTGTTSISDSLFTVGETKVPVTMYIWLEGTDDQCVDQIKLDEMAAQIQFTIVE